MAQRIGEILTTLDSASTVQAMNLPQYRLHALSGNRKGQWAVTVRTNWRIVFRFDDEPEDIELVDYH